MDDTMHEGAEAVEPESPYETFMFMGQLRMRCKQCQFDTYDEGIMNEHIHNIHHIAEDVPIKPLLFDFNNSPLGDPNG